MNVGVYLCECGTNISEKVDLEQVSDFISKIKDVGYVTKIELMCSYNGLASFEADLLEKKTG